MSQQSTNPQREMEKRHSMIEMVEGIGARSKQRQDSRRRALEPKPGAAASSRAASSSPTSSNVPPPPPPGPLRRAVLMFKRARQGQRVCGCDAQCCVGGKPDVRFAFPPGLQDNPSEGADVSEHHDS